MAFSVSAEDVAFLELVDRLGTRGFTQTAIAEELGMTLENLRYRVQRLGLRLAPACRVVDIRSGRLLPELVEAGELTPSGAETRRAPAEIAA